MNSVFTNKGPYNRDTEGPEVMIERVGSIYKPRN